MIRAIIFDCFGVLYVDVSRAYFAKFPQYYDELHNLNRLSDHGLIDRQTYTEGVAKITGISTAKTARAFFAEHTINQPLIDFIKQELKPHYTIGMISNIGREWMHDFFSEHELHDLFDTVVLSGEEGITKPNPLIFERAIERMNVLPDEALFIDDRQDNCRGAEAIGMHSLLYTPTLSNEDIQNHIAKLARER